MKWFSGRCVQTLFDVTMLLWSAGWLIANGLYWHSVSKGSVAGVVVGLSCCSLIYRGVIWHLKRSVEFWKRGYHEQCRFSDDWREMVQQYNPNEWEHARRVVEERAAARKRMN